MAGTTPASPVELTPAAAAAAASELMEGAAIELMEGGVGRSGAVWPTVMVWLEAIATAGAARVRASSSTGMVSRWRENKTAIN